MAPIPVQLTVVSAAAACGPSISSDKPSSGKGGTRLSQTTAASMSTLADERSSTLPVAQKKAAAIVISKPMSVTPPLPALRPITVSPPIAAKPPANWRRLGRSPRTGAAMNTEKNACDCSVAEASPAGIPAAMPENSRPNCPANHASPIAVSRGQDKDGRGRKKAARPAIAKRIAAISSGGKSRKPMLIATNVRPQIAATRTASPICAGFIQALAPIPRSIRLNAAAPRRGFHWPWEPILRLTYCCTAT